MSGTHGASCARVLDCLLNTGIGMSSEWHEFRAGTSIGPTTKLFVCYHAVTALMERFCQNAFAPREAMAAGSRACHLRVQLGRRPIARSRPWGSTRPLNCLRQLPGSLHRGQWDGGSLRMHWALPPL